MAKQKTKGQRCFVIMPFSQTTPEHTEEYWTKHFDDFLKPNIEALPIEAHRAAPLRDDILREIITDVVTAPIVLADLTDSNPNVYWELGVRQSFRHGTITIAEYGPSLPFDIGAKGTLFYYPNDHIRNSRFIRRLHDALRDCMNNPNSPDSHVLQTIGGRGTLFQTMMKDESIRKLDSLLDETTDNQRLFKIIQETCQKNTDIRASDKEGGTRVVTTRFLTASIEALVVHRYLDADTDFYRAAKAILRDLASCNEQILAWDVSEAQRRDEAEQWLQRQCDPELAELKAFEALVKKQQKALLSLL